MACIVFRPISLISLLYVLFLSTEQGRNSGSDYTAGQIVETFFIFFFIFQYSHKA
ncbi:hypothetical protein EV426DRAFT_583720 [Tirmania nivea]|nr:hypothetical protein EV426DRAFT_583720 [Tirmania nivea]